MTWYFLGVLGIQTLPGRTIGVDFLRSLSDDIPVPRGRIPRILHREEEHALYWITIFAQGLIYTVGYFLSKSD